MRKIRDLSCGDARIYLEVEVRRVQCRERGKVKREKLPWLADNPFYYEAVFLFGPRPMIAGMVLWGIGMGAQESIMRAVVADIVPSGRRATGYGIFNAGFGLAWFLGSMTMGILYDLSLAAMAAFSVAAQLSWPSRLFCLQTGE